MPGTRSLANHSVWLVKAWLLKENLQPLILGIPSNNLHHLFYPQVRSVFTPHQGNFSSQQTDHYRKPQPIKMQNRGAKSQWLHLQNTPGTSGSGDTAEEEVERLREPEDQGVCRETVSPRNIRSCTRKVSPTCLPKCELSKEGTNEHANVDWGTAQRPQSYTINYRQLRIAGSRRGGPPQGRAHSWEEEGRSSTGESAPIGRSVANSQP